MSPISASPASVDSTQLLRAIKKFERESLAGAYYAPFNMNSTNYRDIPKETEGWFKRLANLLQAGTQLTKQRKHAQAVACFKILYGLIDAMENGDEIVFAEELGSWMIPGDEKKFIAAYLRSLSSSGVAEVDERRGVLLKVKRGNKERRIVAEQIWADAKKSANAIILDDYRYWVSELNGLTPGFE